jgi:hypothetical protein
MYCWCSLLPAGDGGTCIPHQSLTTIASVGPASTEYVAIPLLEAPRVSSEATRQVDDYQNNGAAYFQSAMASLPQILSRYLPLNVRDNDSRRLQVRPNRCRCRSIGVVDLEGCSLRGGDVQAWTTGWWRGYCRNALVLKHCYENNNVVLKQR